MTRTLVVLVMCFGFAVAQAPPSGDRLRQLRNLHTGLERYDIEAWLNRTNTSYVWWPEAFDWLGKGGTFPSSPKIVPAELTGAARQLGLGEVPLSDLLGRVDAEMTVIEYSGGRFPTLANPKPVPATRGPTVPTQPLSKKQVAPILVKKSTTKKTGSELQPRR